MGDFAEFYATRKDAVLRAVVAATGDRSGGEDAVAEAFAKAYVRWARVAGHASPTAWVVRTALNAYRSWWRRWRRERPSDELATAVDPAGPGTDGQRSDTAVDIRRLVATLPTRQREVVALRILADLPASEVGEVLGIEPATVHVHLHRALTTLRQHMRPPRPATAGDTSSAGMGEL